MTPLEAIKYYTDHLLNEEDPERTAGYELAVLVNEYLELGIEENYEEYVSRVWG